MKETLYDLSRGIFICNIILIAILDIFWATIWTIICVVILPNPSEGSKIIGIRTLMKVIHYLEYARAIIGL